MNHNYFKKLSLLLVCIVSLSAFVQAQGTRLLRQPTLSDTHIAFVYAGDLWVSDISGEQTLRLTSTPAVESAPHFSPDGKTIAFSSNRSGVNTVYTVPVTGGEVTRLTWYPASANVRGWTPDGKKVLYASTRETAPTSFDRLWTVSRDGGVSTMLNAQWGTKASFAANGKQIVIDKVRRWDWEWRAYRGGQNTPLIILNLEDSSEKLLPNESTVDVQPVWLGDKIYFLSDRDWAMNIWMYDTKTSALKQITKFKDVDIKSLSGHKEKLAFERDGYLHTYDLNTEKSTQLELDLRGDFPWARTKWEDVSSSVGSASLSPTGKRAIMGARGEIFTVPVEHGDARNITNNSAAAERSPLWSPKGDKIAWFSDVNGKGYQLMIADQDGLSKPEAISIEESKMAWEPAWSPDGKYIVFTDDDVRIRLIDIEAKTIKTIDVGGNNFERGDLGLTWSKDSKRIAYAKSGANNFRRICIWSMVDDRVRPVTNEMADAFSPAWDADQHHLYFLASTDLALLSNYVNTSVMGAKSANYGAYVINLLKKDPSPFEPRSDEEKVAKEEDKKDAKKEAKDKKKDDKSKKSKTKVDSLMQIDFDGIERRIIPLPMSKAKYRYILASTKGIAFIAEAGKGRGSVLHKFDLKKREAKEFVSGVSGVSISADGNKMLAKMGSTWKVISTKGSNGKSAKPLKVKLKTQLDRMAEWKQMFEEAWRYQRDYFYDPNMHGRDWNEVYDRYSPLVSHIKHRSDLNYVLDQVNGELSVGHSFVSGGDFPKTDRSSVGVLGADLKADGKHWKIDRIYTSESWNPNLSSPLDRPGMKIEEGNYIVGINGKEISNKQDLYMSLDGTAGQQTVLHINTKSDFKGAWKITVKPIQGENSLRQRAWVEDNRRLVDKLSGGRLAYIWVPNTSGSGFVSFNRYYFAQQHKEGAIVDERFNGGGLLDDYMVDLMKRETRSCLTNEVPNGNPIKLPGGIVGPKVLIINELAGSGGDFFPWIFKHQKIGPVVGARTWGGLVKSSVHYSLVDGGRVTAPDNAVFDPDTNEWVGENKGIAPTIEVRQDAKSLNKGIDPQLQRAVKEAISRLPKTKRKITPPPFLTPALKK
jgi:tricorn protease